MSPSGSSPSSVSSPKRRASPLTSAALASSRARQNGRLPGGTANWVSEVSPTPGRPRPIRSQGKKVMTVPGAPTSLP